MNWKNQTACAVGLMAACLFAQPSAAAMCGPAFEDNVFGDLSLDNSGCETGTTNNDFLNPLQVNSDNIFGGGWSYAEKYDFDTGAEETVDVGLTVSGSAQSGTWGVVSTFFDMYDELLLVFKGGNGSDPNTYVGYLFDSGDGITGEYDTPFLNTNGPNDNPANISHITAYFRGDGATVVPLPGGLALMLGALGAGVFAARRRQST